MADKKKLLPAFGLIVAAVGGYFGYDNYMYVHCDNAQVEARTLIVSSRVTGYITQVKADMGERVKAGELLAKIDDRDYVNSLDRAKADLESTDARLQDAIKTHGRLSSLYGKGAATQAQFESATAALNDLKGKILANKSQVAQAQLNLENTEIKAPFDGYIAKKSVEIGQLVSTATPLFGFVDANERWVMANLKETEISSISVGTKVDLGVDAISGQKFSGVVKQVGPSTGATFTLIPPDNATGNFTKVIQRVPVKIAIDDLASDTIHALRVGLSVDVRLHRRNL